MNTSILSALPSEVRAGDEIEVQLAPRGEYPQTVDGREVVQIIDDRSIKSLVANFAKAKEEAKAKGENYQVLVDADHASETGNGTRAMAWVDRVFDDPDRGLVHFDNITVPPCLLTMLPNQTILLGIAEIMQR